MKRNKGKKVLGLLIFLAVFAAISAVIMLLWNWLIPGIIGWSVVNYWQAMGLLVLSRLLLGGLGKLGFAGHMRNGLSHAQMSRVHDKFANMSNEKKREYILRRMSKFEHGFDDRFCKEDKENEISPEAKPE